MAEVINLQPERTLRRVKKALQVLISGFDGRIYSAELRDDLEEEVRAFLTRHTEVPVPWEVVDVGNSEDRQAGVIRMKVVWPMNEVKLEIEVGTP